MNYIIRNPYGAFCSACHSLLCQEEDDFDECWTCGGEGIGDEDEDESVDIL